MREKYRYVLSPYNIITSIIQLNFIRYKHTINSAVCFEYNLTLLYFLFYVDLIHTNVFRTELSSNLAKNVCLFFIHHSSSTIPSMILRPVLFDLVNTKNTFIKIY